LNHEADSQIHEKNCWMDIIFEFRGIGIHLDAWVNHPERLASGRFLVWIASWRFGHCFNSSIPVLPMVLQVAASPLCAIGFGWFDYFGFSVLC
jgi:hypothetical protein